MKATIGIDLIYRYATTFASKCCGKQTFIQRNANAIVGLPNFPGKLPYIFHAFSSNRKGALVFASIGVISYYIVITFKCGAQNCG